MQGLGGAVVAPATLAIITTTFEEGYERNRALGYWGAMGAVGGSTGVLLGGVLTQLLGWQWILFINVPVGILGVVGAMRFIPESTRAVAGERHFDVAGALSRHRRPRAADLRHRAHRRQRLDVGRDARGRRGRPRAARRSSSSSSAARRARSSR